MGEPICGSIRVWRGAYACITLTRKTVKSHRRVGPPAAGERTPRHATRQPRANANAGFPRVVTKRWYAQSSITLHLTLLLCWVL
jgi:hypothetical protein